MAQTLAMLLAYDGADFRGWQRQPGMRTVQGVLEAALASLLGERAAVHGAGRTDAGVHALGQVAHVSVRSASSLLDDGGAAIFPALPTSLRVLRVAATAAGFHARSSAVGKRYRYLFRSGPRAAGEPPAFHLGEGAKPDWERARAALEGLRPLPALPGLGSPSTDRRPAPQLTSWSLECAGPFATLRVEAPGFRKHEVRNLAGHLAAVALGLAAPETLAALAQRRRPWMGATAPPHGLWLDEVLYPVDLDPFHGSRASSVAENAESIGEG